MELGAVVRKTAAAILMIGAAAALSAVDYSWTVGVMPADTSGLTGETDVLAAYQWETQLFRQISRSQERNLTQQERDYLARNYEILSLREHYQEHHPRITRLNEELFSTGTPPVRPEEPSPEFAFDPPQRVPLEAVMLDETVQFHQDAAAFLMMAEEEIDELIGLSVDRSLQGKFELHVYRFLRRSKAETLHHGEYDSTGITDFSGLSQSFGFVSSQEAAADLPEAPLSKADMIRTDPPDAEISGTGDVYHISREGYTSAYLITSGEEAPGMRELKLMPKWKGDIYPIRRRADEFYRSLGTFMLTLPVGFLTYGIAQDNPDAQVLFYGSLGLSVTAAARSLIDLFGYTNYAH